MKWPARGRSLLIGSALGACLTLGCGDGREVNLGSVATAGQSAGGGACNGCGDHVGAKVFVDPSAADVPPNVFDTDAEHAPGTDPNAEPGIVYPSNETFLPLNASLLRFAWTAGTNELFALDFVGPNTNVRVVTRRTELTPTPEQWSWIAPSNRGARVECAVRGMSSPSATESFRSSSVELDFGAATLEGDIYYWSTGSHGMMRARLDTSHPVRFFTDPASDAAATCTGCHTVSRDGKRFAAGYDKNQLGEYSLPDRSTLLAPGAIGATMPPPPAGMTDAGTPAPKAPGPMAWSTFSPDGTRLLVAGGGKLRLYDANTGAAVGGGDGTVALPSGMNVTHPDWSPLGDQVAVAANVKGGDKQTENGSIAVIPFAADAFGAPRILVTAAGDHDNDFFPSFSPDARFIAYVNASGPSQDATSAELRLVEVATGTVRELTRLNQRVSGQDGVTGIGNTMPTWAPTDPSGTYWLTFSSLRAYADLRPQDPKQDQLWVAGIDATLADPGFAAFWAPFQSLDQGNHRAFWTPASGASLDLCGTTCAPAEICDNGIDDDCDCVVDDCSREICDDGIDNDGDGKTDKMDLACAPQ